MRRRNRRRAATRPPGYYSVHPVQVGAGRARETRLARPQSSTSGTRYTGYQMKVRKAVVVAAGLGTRMLPASKVIPKEILPVVDTPAIQIIFEEAIASGIEEIIVVITPGRTLVLDHFKTAADLEQQVERKGKHDLLQMLRKTNDPT